jgi:DNA ligase-1
MENLTNPVFEFSPIYGVDKNGKTKIWKASIHEKDGVAIANIQHGQLSGKLQSTFREYTVGKNIGRKNETTALEQCIQETKRKRQDKLEKEGYKETMNEAHCADSGVAGSHQTTGSPILPMLAHKYEPAKNKKNTIVFPCFAQPKLDGLRCIAYNGANKTPMYQSRTGSLFTTMTHINTGVAALIERINQALDQGPSTHVYLDGELYTDKIPFETLAGLIKKKKITEEDRVKLASVEYHVYDVYITACESMDFAGRWKLLTDNWIPCEGLQLVKTEKVDLPLFREKFNEYIQLGYEGIMLRNIAGIYRTNYRSNDLQKYKEFFEDEFEIVGFGEGEGRERGTVIWNCITEGGREFSVRPKGTIEYRKELFDNAAKYVGKMLTVIYQELSEQGVPRFPVGKAVRDGY